MSFSRFEDLLKEIKIVKMLRFDDFFLHFSLKAFLSRKDNLRVSNTCMFPEEVMIDTEQQEKLPLR